MPRIERRSPLPPGRYWVDVVGPRRASAQAWFAANRGSVRVIRSEVTDATDGGWFGQPQPAVTWYLFDVSSPTPYDVQAVGSQPTIVRQAAADSKDGRPINEPVSTQADTTSRGSSEEPGDSTTLPILLIGGLALLLAVARKA